MTDGRHISQEDLALYALQALDAQEAAAVRAHLQACAQCRAVSEELTGDLALVALSVEQQPLPAGARERFMQRIAADEAGSTPAPQVIAMPTRPRKTFAVWVAWGAAAAMALLSVSLGIRVNELRQQLQQESAQAAQLQATNARAQNVLDVLTAPEAQHVLLTAAKVRTTPSARAVYLASRGGLIFQANNLEPLPEDKAYELWVIPANGKAPIPAGVFRPDAEGNASVVLPSLPKGVPAKAFGVTIERAAGSATPTLPIILAGAAPTAGG